MRVAVRSVNPCSTAWGATSAESKHQRERPKQENKQATLPFKAWQAERAECPCGTWRASLLWAFRVGG